jgi:hypothetical protein
MDPISTGLSGMNVASLNVQATANAANLRPEDQQVGRVDQAAQANQTNQAEQAQTRATQNQTAQLAQDRQDARTDTDYNVQVERENNTIQNDNAYSANASVIRTSAQAMGTVMDLKA